MRQSTGAHAGLYQSPSSDVRSAPSPTGCTWATGMKEGGGGGEESREARGVGKDEGPMTPNPSPSLRTLFVSYFCVLWIVQRALRALCVSICLCLSLSSSICLSLSCVSCRAVNRCIGLQKTASTHRPPVIRPHAHVQRNILHSSSLFPPDHTLSTTLEGARPCPKLLLLPPHPSQPHRFSLSLGRLQATGRRRRGSSWGATVVSFWHSRRLSSDRDAPLRHCTCSASSQGLSPPLSLSRALRATVMLLPSGTCERWSRQRAMGRQGRQQRQWGGRAGSRGGP